MNRIVTLTVLLAAVLTGCASGVPVVPDTPGSDEILSPHDTQIYDERYRLWGAWKWYIPETHDRIEMIPQRISQGHLNVLKWVEDMCYDCVEIAGVHNNGDSTIDVMVRITHPRPGEAVYTGFDVKGIVMFDGTYEMPSVRTLPPYGDTVYISARELGDPELLNADGFTMRWSPSYDSGSSLPILNYWKGRHAFGADPAATLNGYIDFYTNEERHMFEAGKSVTRTYHIHLPQGPISMGYAVEACWVPPDVMPVTDPVEDFPISANQAEPYYYRVVINNGEPIKDPDCCGWDMNCEQWYIDARQWQGVKVQAMKHFGTIVCGGMSLVPCPEDPSLLRGTPVGFGGYPDGTHKGYAVIYRVYDENYNTVYDQVAYTVYEWTVDVE